MLEDSEGDLLRLLPFQRAYLEIYDLVQDQRIEKFSGLGAIIQSEIWMNLKEHGYRGESKMRAFRMIVAIDRMFREIVAAQEKKQREAAKEEEEGPAAGIAKLKEQSPGDARKASKAI